MFHIVRAAQNKCRMGVDCEITFDDNPNGVFRTGDFVAGKVKLTASEPTPVQGIFIELFGSGSVWWTEKWGDSEDSFTGNEEYICEKQYILQTQGEQVATLSTGAHVYTFRFDLPKTLPSTFKGLNGSIKYKVSVNMEKGGKKFKSFKKPIDVVAVLDLNSDPSFKLPLHSENEKQLWWACCGVDTIKFELKLFNSAYSTGLPIPFYVLVRNDSTSDCSNSKIQLVQTIEYISKSMREKTISSSNVVIEKSLGPIPKQSRKELEDSLDIPTTIPASSLDSSSILRVSYSLKLLIIFRGCHTSGELHCPIVVGTIPFEESRKGSSLASSSISDLNTIPVRHLMEKRMSFARELPKWNRNIS